MNVSFRASQTHSRRLIPDQIYVSELTMSGNQVQLVGLRSRQQLLLQQQRASSSTGLLQGHGIGAAGYGVYQTISKINMENRKTNTVKAYQSKGEEYIQFCNYAYGGDFQINCEKAFEFLVYVAFRNKRRRGGKRNAMGEHVHAPFDHVEYEGILQTWSPENLLQATKIPDPDNPVGPVTMNTYKSVLFNIYQYQYANGIINETWKHIFDGKCRDLIKMVKERSHRIRRANYKEKLNGEFAPFTTYQHFEKCEEWLWFHGEKSCRSAMKALRNRFAFINCYKELLRHESLFLGELSDLLHLEITRSMEEDPLFISILQIEQGKTVSTGSRQYGRALRGKDVKTCPVGALAFYLFFRFRQSGEMDDGNRPNFCENSSWFDIKLMSDGSLENKKQMQKNTFTEQVEEMFANLRIISNHTGHWGRVAGPAALEKEELDQSLVRILGNWEPSTQEQRYSSRIPTKALRVMAGFKADEPHLNPRYVTILL